MNHILKDKVQEKGDPLRGNILTFVWPCATHRFQGSDLRFYTVLFRCCSNFFYGQPRRGWIFLRLSLISPVLRGDVYLWWLVGPRRAQKQNEKDDQVSWNWGKNSLESHVFLSKEDRDNSSVTFESFEVRSNSQRLIRNLFSFSSKTIILSLNNHQHVRVNNYGCRIDIYVSAVFSRFM